MTRPSRIWGAVARLVELELGAAGDDLLTELDKRLDDVAQVEQLGPAAADRQHVGGERSLRRGVPPQLVQHHLGRGVALQLDDDAHAVPVGLVADVADALDPLVLGRLRDALDQRVLALLIGNLGQHDRAAVVAADLHLVARADDYGAAPALVRGTRAGAAEDDRAGREIRTRHDRDQLLQRDRVTVHAGVEIGEAGVDDLAQIVRRDVGRHADGDAARAVDQQVGELRRQDLRLALGRVVIGLEVDRVLVEVVEQAVRHLRQPRLRVAHRGGRVGVHRAEIALAVDQRHPHRPVLRHPRQGVVDRGVAVRVVLTDHVADDARRLAERLVVPEAALGGGVEDAAMHRLQPVAHVGQRAGDNDAHRVIEIARLHLVDDRDGGDV